MVLEFRNIQKSFGEKEVLKGISFTTEGKKAFGLLGRNGAGKTTAIRILMGVFPANSGEVLVDGKPIDRASVGIGYLPEERGLYPKKKIIDQLVYFAELKGMSRKDAEKSIDYWLSRLEMSEYKNKSLDTLSKGNQQKIQLVTALAHDPQIIILDEPFSGLDPVNAMLLKSVVKEEISKGKIVIFSSHQMSYIEEFCDRIAIINGGKTVLHGDLAEIKRNCPRNKLVIRSVDADAIMKKYESRCSLGENGEILFRLDDESEKSGVMNALVSEYDVDEIKVFEPSLNDIFVEYAEEQM
ncbi:MAG: ATP-binding cassette domain-containing protein [Clostridia bacterium]|nr:ATP-binding cassette domain-containing protein [Clostridia bacterium]